MEKENIRLFLETLKKEAHISVIEEGDKKGDCMADEMPIHKGEIPIALVMPESEEGVAKTLKLCGDFSVPVTVRGAGTGLTGASCGRKDGIVLSTEKMKRIIKECPEEKYMVLEPGVSLDEIKDRAEKMGLIYPPDPGEGSASIGGNISTNAAGPRSLKYGSTGTYVRSLRAALPDGSILDTSKSRKSSQSMPFTQLFVGAEGKLGVITQITLNLEKRQETEVLLLLPFSQKAAALRCAQKLMEKFSPAALEYWEEEIAVFQKDKCRLLLPDLENGKKPQACLLAALDGEEDEVYENAEAFSEYGMELGAEDALIADTPRQKRELWEGRTKLFEELKNKALFLDEWDGAVPPEKIEDYMEFIETVRRDERLKGVHTCVFGHVGDGNLHIYLYRLEEEDEKGDQEAVTEETFKEARDWFMEKAYRKAAEMGGVVSGEHGIGKAKEKYRMEFADPVKLKIEEGIKKAFDPTGILK